MSNIYIAAFTDQNDFNGNATFQGWGIDNIPNLYWFTEIVNNSPEFQQYASDFNITVLPTVIATKVIQEEPLRVEEVGRFQGMITRQKLDQLLANAQNTNANGGQGQNGGTGSGSGGSSSGSGSGGSGGSGSGGGGAYSKKGLGILPLLILGFFAFRSRED